MQWPQFVALAVLFFDLIISLVTHGKPRRGSHNAVVTAIVAAAWLFILFKGGFFH